MKPTVFFLFKLPTTAINYAEKLGTVTPYLKKTQKIFE